MKKILLFLTILILPLSVFSAEVDGSVNIGATVPGGGGGGGNDPDPTITQSLSIEPEGGSVSQNCGDVSISFSTVLDTYSDEDLQSSSQVATVGELGYKTGTDDYTVVVDGSAQSHDFGLDDLAIGLTYEYYIKSTYDSLSDTDTGSFTVTCAPPTPQLSVVAVDGNARLEIDYGQSQDEITQVLIERNIDGGVREDFYTLDQSPPATQNLVDENISLGSEYCYTLKVFNGYQWSGEVEDCALRLVPEIDNISANGLNGRIDISWSEPQDNSENDFLFDGIVLSRSDESCSDLEDVLLQGDYLSFSDLNVENEQTYYYKIKVKNSYDEYSSGVCVSAIPSSQGSARCISDISYASGDQRVEINWKNPENEAGVFELENVRWQRGDKCYGNIQQSQGTYAGTGQSFTDEGLINGQRYYYSAFVVYNGGQSINCGCISAVPSGDSEEPPTICPDCTSSFDHPQFHFSVNGGGLEIYPDNEGRINILSAYDLEINTAREDLPKPVFAVVASLLGREYYLSLDNISDNYRSLLTVPGEIGDYPLTLSTVYQDDTISEQRFILSVRPRGYVYSGDDRLSGAEVSLYLNGELFFGHGVAGEQKTDEKGLYGLMVPDGDYVVRANKLGYLENEIEISVADNIINQNIELKKATEIVEDIREVIGNNQPTIGAGITALAFINLASSTPFFNILAYLQYIFSEPFAWLFRKKKKGWGVVYDSLSKKPIDLAVVRLHDFETKKVLRSKVTDKEGRYNFIVEAGKYYLEAVKSGYEFPSDILKNVEDDKNYPDIYHGEEIVVGEEEKGAVTANIPMDKEAVEKSDEKIIKDYNWSRFKEGFSLVGPLIALAVFIVAPSIWSGVMVVFHLAFLAVFKRIASAGRPAPWGTVFAKDDKEPLSRAVVRIFSPEHNRMVEAQVTDSHGRYGFLVDDNVYYLTAKKEGYGQYKSDNIDLTGKESEDVVGRDIYLSSGSRDMTENSAQNLSDNNSSLQDSSLDNKQKAKPEMYEDEKIEKKEESKEEGDNDNSPKLS